MEEERSLRSLPPTYAPSLVFSHGKKFRDQIFCTLSDNQFHATSVPEMRRMKCIASCYGWLILQNIYDSTQFNLFNPATLSNILLPPFMHGSVDFGVLTSSPSDPSCCYITLFSQKKKLLIFCRIGDSVWIEQQLVRDKQTRKHIADCLQSVISCQGKVYLFYQGGVAIVDICESIASIKIHEDMDRPDLSVPEESYKRSSYVESCGDIFVLVRIFVGYSLDRIRTFDVFKLDMSRMVWTKVESFGDRVFLLGRSCTSLSSSEFGVKGNYIYFFLPGYTNWYRFDIDEGTVTTSFLSTLKISHWREPFWVVPDSQGKVNKNESKAIVVKNNFSEFGGSKRAAIKEEMRWEDLPIEMLELIVASLCQCDCICFRITCKALISITTPLRPNPLLIQSNRGTPKLPWLMCFPKINKGICNLYNPILGDVCKVDVPELTGAVIRDTNYGWLLMSEGNNSIFFFNPLTKEIIKLPDLDKCYSFVGIGFSSPPTSSDCVVFGITTSHPTFLKMTIYCKEEDNWCSYEYMHSNKKEFEFIAADCNPIFCEGVFFCLGKDGKLGIFNPNEREDDDLIWRVLPKSSIFSISKLQDIQSNIKGFLVEYDGEILSIFDQELLGKSICVYKWDREMWEWVKSETLSDKVLFLSPTKSILMPAELKGLENRIFLPRFDVENKMMYHCLGSKGCCGYWKSKREYSWNCTWIQMTT